MRDYTTLCKLRTEATAKTARLYFEWSVARAELRAIDEELITLIEAENTKKRIAATKKATAKAKKPNDNKELTPKRLLASMSAADIEELRKLLTQTK